MFITQGNGLKRLDKVDCKHFHRSQTLYLRMSNSLFVVIFMISVSAPQGFIRQKLNDINK